MKQLKIYFLLPAIAAIIMSCGHNTHKHDQHEANITVKSEIIAPYSLTHAEIDDGWVLLFDGKSTDHWRGYQKETFPEKGWIVENGTLKVLSSGRGEAGGGGDIITKNKYKNFELSLDWKVSEGGNSGIFYLAQEKPGQPIWKSAPEMQILDNEKHPDAKLGKDGNRAAGSLYDLIPGNMDVVKPAG